MISSLTGRRALVIGLCGLALFFCLYRLTESPPFWYDEGWYVQTAANLASMGTDGIQLSPGNIQHIAILTVGYPLIYPLGLWVRIFGSSVFVVRFFMVLCILMFLAAAYALIRRLYGAWPATAALALIATFPPLYGNGKSVLGEVPGMLYMALFLLAYARARSFGARRAFWLMLAGLSAGACLATKPIFLLLGPAILLGAFIEWRRKALSPKEIVGSAICVAIPLAVWFIVQFHAGVSSSGILSFYANPYHADSLLHVFISNIRRLLTDSSIIYTACILGVWSIGLWLKHHARKHIRAEEIISYIFSVLVAVAFLRIGAIYRYLFQAQVLALIFLAPALNEICGWISVRFGYPKKPARFVAGAVVLLCSLNLYQLAFSSWVADSYQSQKTAFWQGSFGNLPADTSVFFYDTPEVAPFMRTRNYYQYLLAPAGRPTGSEELGALKGGQADEVIIVTDIYADENARDSALFAKYALAETDYKYSILKRK